MLLLPACTPTYDWREVHGTGVPFTVLMPAKPLTESRPANLDGLQVTMTMTAAEAGGSIFAVGSAELPDAAQAPAALQAMKTALVKNIGGTIRRETPASAACVPEDVPTRVTSVEIEAASASDSRAGAPVRVLFARFVAKDKRVYQVAVIGLETSVKREAVETFLTSFKLD
jgi:hypothetical protein